MRPRVEALLPSSGVYPVGSDGQRGFGPTAQPLGDGLDLATGDTEAAKRIARHLHGELLLAFDGLTCALVEQPPRLLRRLDPRDDLDPRVHAPRVLDRELGGRWVVGGEDEDPRPFHAGMAQQ